LKIFVEVLLGTWAGNLPIVYPFYFAKKNSYVSNEKPVILGILNIFWMVFC
jgi:hypothetical protein